MTHYPNAFQRYTKKLALSLTSIRKAVLYILWKAQKPLKAYDILELLASEQPNATAAAVYRALGFFMASGFVHKVDSIQSYALCVAPETLTCSEILMVCATCHEVNEIQDTALRDAARLLGDTRDFILSHEPIELRGICESCVERD